MNSEISDMDPETSEDEQPVPIRMVIAQKDVAQIVVAWKAVAQKATARKVKSRAITKSTRVTPSGSVLCQSCSKQKR